MCRCTSSCLPVQANWAEGPGRDGIEKVYMSSRKLDGDAVVIFMRALCAVSQEELMPANPEEPARYARLPLEVSPPSEGTMQSYPAMKGKECLPACL